MQTTIALLLVLVLSSSFNTTEPVCRRIEIIGFKGRKGKVDRFDLVPLVKRPFEELGFEVVEGSSAAAAREGCPRFQCLMRHPENYWKLKRNTVSLTILNASGKEIKQYQGITGETEMTFKAGYSNATLMALSQISVADFR